MQMCAMSCNARASLDVASDNSECIRAKLLYSPFVSLVFALMKLTAPSTKRWQYCIRFYVLSAFTFY